MTGNTRTETDSFGPIEVAADAYWGAQTQRSIENFPIGGERLPLPLVTLTHASRPHMGPLILHNYHVH